MLNDDSSIQVLGEVSSGEEALDWVQQAAMTQSLPDVVLMDLKMPGMGGLEATRRLNRQNSAIKVVVVSACTDDPYPARVLESGASAYVSKSSHVSEMIRAINKSHLGERYLSSDIAQAMALSEREATPFDQLSERELQIAMMIMDCQKVQVISDTLCLSPKTVNSYRYRIFEKLGVTSDVEMTLLAVRSGLIEVDGA